ncbi:MAG: 1-acyl-sn-glycerol-3-phosphate acyltransferase [Candidatus Aminicenantes bacterium]|nr:1-acyl-sn-glycerol-3-phosphate acyltransferase [Candidatus Aminicenantes bacterium]
MTTLGERLRSNAVWGAALPVFAALCLVVWLASFILRGRPLERLIKACCRFVLALCGVRLKIEGGANVDPRRQYIVMMNHVNFFDPLVFYAGFPGMARGVEEESHFRWPVYGPTIRRLGVVPISRTDTPRAIASLERAAVLIRRHRDFSFAVLPEGTRTLNGRLGPFKRGGFHLAVETGLDILPLVQVGANRINHKGTRLIRPGRLRCVIGPAVPVSGFSKENLDGLIDRVRSVFLEHLGS